MSEHKHLLTAALVEILQTAVEVESTNSKILSKILSRSEATIHTEWQRINERLGSSSRPMSLIRALKLGIVTLPPAPSEEEEKE